MFILSRKILSYFCYVITINTHFFDESNPNCIIGNDFVNDEPESEDTNLQVNPNTYFEHIHPTQQNEIESFLIVPLDLTVETRERKKYLSNEHHPSSLLSNTEEGCSQNIIYEQHSSEESNSSEKSEYIDVVNIDESDNNNHSNLLVTELENNQIQKSFLGDTTSMKNLHTEIDETHISEEVNVDCSKSQYNHTYPYDTMRFDGAPSSSNETFAVSTNLEHLKTNQKHHNISESEVISRSLEHHSDPPTETIKQQYLPNLVPIKRTALVDNIASNVSIQRVGKENLLNTNKISGHFKRSRPGTSYELDNSYEPLRKKFKNISIFEKDNSSLVSSTPEIIRNTQKHIMHTGNHLDRGHTLSLSHIAEEDSIRWDSTDTNTLQQTFQDTDLNQSHVKQINYGDNLQILKQSHESTYDDEASLKETWGDFYYFRFIIKNIWFSCRFNRKKKLSVCLKISGTPIPIIRTNSEFAKEISNIPTKSPYSRLYVYSIPIFHKVDFESVYNVDYFRISVSPRKYEIEQRLEIYIFRFEAKNNPELHLKCPRIRDFKGLIDKLLKTTFPIYPFCPKSTKISIQFLDLISLGKPIKEMTLNQYIEKVKRNYLHISIQDKRKSKTKSKLQDSKKKAWDKSKIIWESGIKFVYEIHSTFNKNIKQILKIINDNSKSLDYKKEKINELLTQIIQKIEINFVIYYPLKKSKFHQIDIELMSFYVFCINELKKLFKWWNKYIFVSKEVQYIETGLWDFL